MSDNRNSTICELLMNLIRKVFGIEFRILPLQKLKNPINDNNGTDQRTFFEARCAKEVPLT